MRDLLPLLNKGPDINSGAGQQPALSNLNLMKPLKVVIPAQAGIQAMNIQLKTLDSRFHGNDVNELSTEFCGIRFGLKGHYNSKDRALVTEGREVSSVSAAPETA